MKNDVLIKNQVLKNVKEILKEQPETRDSDIKLYEVLLRKRYGVKTKTLTVDALIKGLLKGTYPKWETVRRSRQLIQEKYPSLRGKTFRKRHKITKKVKEEIRKAKRKI